MLDRVVLVAELQEQIDGRSGPVLFRIVDVGTRLTCRFFESPDNGVADLAFIVRHDHGRWILPFQRDQARSVSRGFGSGLPTG